MRWALCLVACACGRLQFDAIGDGGTSDSASGDVPLDALMPIIFGDQTVEVQGPDNHPPGVAEASSYYATQTGVVDELLIYYAGTYPQDDATALIAGLYTDDGSGNPATLLGGATISPGAMLTKQTWYAAPIPATAIIANRYYWIAAACPVGSGNQCSFAFKYYGASGPGPCTPTPAEQCTQHSAQANLVTMPATWSPGTTYLPSINSYFAAHE